MSSIYELTTLYIPIVQPVHLPATVTIDPSSYWHVSALYALLYDSITLPTRTRREQSYAMDMDELAARLNIHGQRKITNPKVAVLSESLRPNDIISLGWPEVIGDRPITAVVVRGWMKDVHELTGSFGQNAHISEWLKHNCIWLTLAFCILNNFLLLPPFPRYSRIISMTLLFQLFLHCHQIRQQLSHDFKT